MADNHTTRPYRNTGDLSGTPAPGNDPLAELARLIGQSDPFGEFARGQAKAGVQEPASWDPPAPAWPSAPQQPLPPQQSHYPDYQPPSVAYTDDLRPPPRFLGGVGEGPGPQEYAASHDGRETGGGYQQDERFYAAQPPVYGAQPGYGQDGYDEQSADFDEDAEQNAVRRKRRIVALASLATVVVIVGAAGAVGYRSLFGSSGSSPPPVIKADTSPNKIVPAQDALNKPIQDRLGGSERLVSREEQPGDGKPQPRMVFPGPVANAGAQNGGGATEPKRIRTVSIRPDQPIGLEAPVPSARTTQPQMPTRTASATPITTVPIAPQQAMPQQGAPPQPAQPPAHAGPTPIRPVAPQPPAQASPLSLSPDDGLTASAPAARTAAVQPRATAPVSGSGAYVQVASQRNEADAQASFRALQAKYAGVLGSRTAVIHKADLGAKGTYYRAMIGPLASQDAVSLCGNLKAAGGSCIIQKN